MANDFPIDECIQRAMPYAKKGALIHQKWTCARCGARQTMEEANRFFLSGICEECGSVTKIERCNYVMMLGRVASVLLLCLFTLASDARADVYMFNGLGGIWSSGLGQACAYLNERRKIPCHVGQTPEKNGRPIVLVGHSMGGSTAINYALHNPVHTVILLDPVGSASHLRAQRIVVVTSEGWNTQGPQGSEYVRCKGCSHTSLDDSDRVQFVIIQAAVAAHGGLSPVDNLSTAVIPAARASAPTPARKQWQRRRR